ncbi:MAG TPA: AAA family ATPase, partial [Anaerolineales bacterium]|nr:AAA family ATPase [Anaerolineales bacterium]
MTLNKSVISPVLIGRADDLAVVNRLMEQAAQGHGQIGLISGEAGIGKSRLVLEAIQHASELDLQVLKGNCFETDRALPYAPLLDLLRTFRSEHRGKDLSAYFKSTSRELAKILPELAEIVHHNSSAPALEPEQEKYRLFQALAQFLIERSKDTLLIVIEDLHWCDETSLDFLLYFTRYLQNQPILLLLTYRSDEVNPALGHFLAELDRQRLAIELALSRLSAEEINAMLRAIFDLNRPIRPEFINILYPLTEGNPFFIEEILKSLIVAGEIFYSDGTWDRRPIDELSIPRSVQDAVRRRAEQLSASAKDILSLAAVMGQRFDFSLLRDLTALDDDELLKLIKELIAVQLITEESGERFVFRHALTREAIYSQLMERERRNLHKKIGESIERLGENSLDEQTANLAYHFYQANAWQKAMQYSERAGQNAQRLYAPRAAIEHLTHAIDSARHLSLLPSSGVYRARGSAHETLGDFEQARADYESALQSSISIQDQRKEWLSLLDLGALWTGRDYSEAGKYYQRAYELACDINDSELLAHTLNRLGNWSVNIERPDEGLRYHKKALELFESLKDQKGLAETFDLLGMANYIHGDLIQSENYYQQAVEIFRELDDRAGLTSSLASMMLNNSHLQSGIGVPAETKHENAMQGGEEALRIAREIGWRSGEVYAITILGNFLAVKGEYSKALDLANASLAIAEEIEHS